MSLSFFANSLGFPAAIAASLLLISPASHGWGAIAYNKAGGSYIHTKALTPQDASRLALEGCERTTDSPCQVAFDPAQGAALVVARGATGSGFSANRDPRKAASNAVQECATQSKGCKVVNAAWDGGQGWIASASAAEGTGWAALGGTPSEAAQNALAKCRTKNDEKGTCKASSPVGGAMLVHFVVAASASSPALAYSYSPNMQEAERAALRLCSEDAKDCAVTSRETNGYVPEPASMKPILAMAESARPVRDRSVTPARTPQHAPVRPRCINPATGLPMLALDGSCAGIDVMGNPYGMKTH
jgi:hypothetical protein